MKNPIQKQFERVSELPKNQFVSNLNWQDSSGKVDVILIGDNPGKTEKDTNEFFTGKTKPIMDLVKLNLQQKNKKAVLVMNKSNFHTNRTNSLIEILKNPDNDDFEKVRTDIQKNAELVNELFEKNKGINVIFFGSDNTPLSKSFLSFLKIPDDNIFFMKHPSNNHLANQLTEYFMTKINSGKKIPTDLLEIFKEIKG